MKRFEDWECLPGCNGVQICKGDRINTCSGMAGIVTRVLCPRGGDNLVPSERPHFWFDTGDGKHHHAVGAHLAWQEGTPPCDC